eukprot:SAG31_NODE_46928_length_252_cov_0.836601_1_plen_20_part_10
MLPLEDDEVRGVLRLGEAFV